MLKLNLQFFGGRGASSSSSSGSDGEGNIKIKNEVDVWSERHKKKQEEAATQIINATRDMEAEYGVMDHVESVSVANFDKKNVLAFYAPDENKVVFNRSYTDLNKVQQSYQECVDKKFHPSLGNKTPIEAITAHELGHAIADKINDKRRATKSSTVDANSEIVINAYRKLYPNKANTYEEYTGIPKARATISGYAKKNYHETIAEAVADVYCNGGKAKKFSKAVVAELKDTIKREL